MFFTRMMHQCSLSVRSVVSGCLRFVRPSLPVVGQLLPTCRLYSSTAHSSAKAKAAPKQEPLSRGVSDDNRLVETKKQASETVNGLRISRQYQWTTEEVSLLKEGAELRQTSGWTWPKVAELVGGGITAAHCRTKWQSLNNIHSQKQTEWDDKEIALLAELVEKHTDPVTKRVSWKHLSTALNRPARQISDKWSSVTSQKAIRFSPEQDALIQQRVAAWGVKSGLWASLQKELGFRATTIRTRYYRLVAGTSNMVYFTPEMDQVILDERKVDKPGKRVKGGDWNRIAARVGPNVTPSQCQARWVDYLRHKARGLRVGVEFTQDELARIAAFAEEHAALKEIPWSKLGKELNALPRECQDKWRDIRQRKMKKGYFSAEEDAVLLLRVKEWGDPKLRKGLWVALEKEMNRPADSLSKRWNWLCIVGSEGVGVVTK